MRNKYLLSFVLVFGLLIKTSYGKNQTKLLLISFDGFRWDYVQRRPDLESFVYLKEHGVHAKYLESVFPSLTSPAHTSLATGLYPESHGVVHNVNYNKSDSSIVKGDFYSTLTVNEWFDNGYEPIWITANTQGLKSGGYLFPGSNATVGGKAASRSILETEETRYDEETWRTRIDDVMSWFKDEDFDFIALYFEEPDVTGHENGPYTEKIAEEALPLVNRTIAYLLKSVEDSGLQDDLNIVFVSDHGMTEMKNETIDVSKYVDDSDILFQFQYAGLGLVEPHPDKMENVHRQLKEAGEPMDVYYKKDVPKRLHYADNDRVTSIVIMAELGYALQWKNHSKSSYAGHHGYDPSDPEMRSSFYAIGPSFKENYEIPGFSSVHVYELMCHLLGLSPAPNNGSLEVLLPTLKHNHASRTTFSLCLLYLPLTLLIIR